MLTSEQLEKLNEMIRHENDLACMMAFIHIGNKKQNYFEMNGNPKGYFNEYCGNLQKKFAQEVLNDAMLKRVKLQKEISKFVVMSFSDEKVELSGGNDAD